MPRADFYLIAKPRFRDEPLPLSGAGKILKTELRKPFWAGKEKAVN